MTGNTMIYLPGQAGLGWAGLIIYQVIWNDQSVMPDLSLSRKFAIIEILKTHNLHCLQSHKVRTFPSIKACSVED